MQSKYDGMEIVWAAGGRWLVISKSMPVIDKSIQMHSDSVTMQPMHGTQ